MAKFGMSVERKGKKTIWKWAKSECEWNATGKDDLEINKVGM